MYLVGSLLYLFGSFLSLLKTIALNGVGKKQAKAAGTIQARFNEVRKYRQESAAASLIQGKLANKLQVSASPLFETCLLCVEGFRNVCVLVFVCLR